MLRRDQEEPGVPSLALPLALIHPSDPWPLPGHREAMKKSYRRDYFHTSAWKGDSQKFAKKKSSAFARVLVGWVSTFSEQLLLLPSRVARSLPVATLSSHLYSP